MTPEAPLPEQKTARRARAAGWAVGVSVAIVVAIGLVLMFLLTSATDNRALYERNYAWANASKYSFYTFIVFVFGEKYCYE